MIDKTALVTGGSDGIGKEIACGLASAGMRVVLAGRDPEKGIRAQQYIRDKTGNQNIHFLQADLSLMRDTNRLANDVAALSPELHFLVHCAGMVRGRRVVSAEHIESNFAVNYLSRFLLTTRLLPLLKAASRPLQSSRVVIISGAAQGGKIYFEDANLTSNFMTLRAVRQSCQANDVFTMELARRVATGNEKPPVTVTCLKIGAVKTNIRQEFPLWMKLLVPLVVDPLLAITAQQAAESALALLLAKEYEAVTGALFLKIKTLKPLSPDKTVLDPEEGGKLWSFSERMIHQANGQAAAK
jgi:NAD(P)-dependent dehydrogenase (short-subunit alcohol dehydrogenase family)